MARERVDEKREKRCKKSGSGISIKMQTNREFDQQLKINMT